MGEVWSIWSVQPVIGQQFAERFIISVGIYRAENMFVNNWLIKSKKIHSKMWCFLTYFVAFTQPQANVPWHEKVRKPLGEATDFYFIYSVSFFKFIFLYVSQINSFIRQHFNLVIDVQLLVLILNLDMNKSLKGIFVSKSRKKSRASCSCASVRTQRIDGGAIDSITWQTALLPFGTTKRTTCQWKSIAILVEQFYNQMVILFG